MLATAFDGLDDLVYIADLETYDLLYANRACRQSFHFEDSTGRKCYGGPAGAESALRLLHQSETARARALVLELFQSSAPAPFRSL